MEYRCSLHHLPKDTGRADFIPCDIFANVHCITYLQNDKIHPCKSLLFCYEMLMCVYAVMIYLHIQKKIRRLHQLCRAIVIWFDGRMRGECKDLCNASLSTVSPWRNNSLASFRIIVCCHRFVQAILLLSLLCLANCS